MVRITSELAGISGREAFLKMSESETKALLDLLVFAVLSDKHVSEVELSKFDEEISELPLINDMEKRDSIVQHAVKTRYLLEENLANEDYIRQFLREVSSRLPKGVREVVLEMFCNIILADGLGEGERELCKEVADTLEVASERVDELIGELTQG